MDPLALYLLAGFALAVVFGVVASIGNFCTMGALSDLVNLDEWGRVRSWALAVGLAIAGFSALDLGGRVDPEMLLSRDTAAVPYLVAGVPVLRLIVGGLLFGIGMTVAGGCSSKNLLRLGSGDLKALVALVALGLAAWGSVYTETGSAVLAAWSEWRWTPGESQSAPALIGTALGLGPAALRWLGLGVGAGLVLWALWSREFRTDAALLTAGVGIGAVVIAAWAITGGALGEAAMESSDFADVPTIGMDVQALSFTAPIGQGGYYLLSGLPAHWLSFGVCVCAGVIVGSLLHALLRGQFRLQAFKGGQGVLAHVLGGALMGFGGVMSMGCTVGQGISGLSTLAVGSMIAIASIAIGSLLTLRFQLYRLLNEEAGLAAVVGAAMVDTFKLPDRWRPLERAD